MSRDFEATGKPPSLDVLCLDRLIFYDMKEEEWHSDVYVLVVVVVG